MDIPQLTIDWFDIYNVAPIRNDPFKTRIHIFGTTRHLCYTNQVAVFTTVGFCRVRGWSEV